MRTSRLLALGTGALLCALLGACDNSDTPPPVTPQAAADDAFTFTVPLYKFFATQRAYIAQGLVPNVFVHARALADASLRTVTKPNHDTLYSIAWLKLDNGPVQIDSPASGGRYFSLALMDAYTNDFAVRGTREDGGQAVRFWVAGPAWTGTPPAGTVLLRSQTNAVWALARTYTTGTPEDYPLAWSVQDQLVLTLPAGTAPSAWDDLDLLPPPAETDWATYFPYVDQLLTKEPPPADDQAFLAAGPQTIGVGVGLEFDPTSVDMAQVGAGATQARERALQVPAAVTSTGWAHAAGEIGAYGTDYELRAQFAEAGLGALPTAEAVYFIANTALATPTTPLMGATPYEIVFPAGGLPPTGAFWSLTLYEGQDGAHEYFYANPDNIYAISYPASNPVTGADGSLTLTISHVQPADVPLSNWLPAPEGSYSLQLRDYLPPASVLDGSYVPPPVTAVSP